MYIYMRIFAHERCLTSALKRSVYVVLSWSFRAAGLVQ